MSYPSREADKFMLRMLPGMRDMVREAAAAARRSMNSEIVYQLERAYRFTGAAGQVSEANNPAASSNPTACQGGEIINHG